MYLNYGSSEHQSTILSNSTSSGLKTEVITYEFSVSYNNLVDDYCAACSLKSRIVVTAANGTHEHLLYTVLQACVHLKAPHTTVSSDMHVRGVPVNSTKQLAAVLCCHKFGV